nr:importin-5-like [Ipomoea batatas]GMD58279.1 importin-5-like [Ipomoea batatas]
MVPAEVHGEGKHQTTGYQTPYSAKGNQTCPVQLLDGNKAVHNGAAKEAPSEDSKGLRKSSVDESLRKLWIEKLRYPEGGAMEAMDREAEHQRYPEGRAMKIQGCRKIADVNNRARIAVVGAATMLMLHLPIPPNDHTLLTAIINTLGATVSDGDLVRDALDGMGFLARGKPWLLVTLLEESVIKILSDSNSTKKNEVSSSKILCQSSEDGINSYELVQNIRDNLIEELLTQLLQMLMCTEVVSGCELTEAVDREAEISRGWSLRKLWIEKLRYLNGGAMKAVDRETEISRGWSNGSCG